MDVEKLFSRPDATDRMYLTDGIMVERLSRVTIKEDEELKCGWPVKRLDLETIDRKVKLVEDDVNIDGEYRVLRYRDDERIYEFDAYVRGDVVYVLKESMEIYGADRDRWIVYCDSGKVDITESIENFVRHGILDIDSDIVWLPLKNYVLKLRVKNKAIVGVYEEYDYGDDVVVKLGLDKLESRFKDWVLVIDGLDSITIGMIDRELEKYDRRIIGDRVVLKDIIKIKKRIVD
jgi:hypothetical protein